MFTYGHQVTFHCQSGFSLHGPQSLICTEHGLWSDIPPVCKPKVCPSLSSPSYGTLQGRNLTFNATINVVCNSGFVLKGHRDVTCTSAGNWSSSLPVCDPIHCPAPLAPPHASIQNLNTSYMGMVSYSCQPGYYAVGGSTTQHCTASGVWDRQPLVCHGMDIITVQAPHFGASAG